MTMRAMLMATAMSIMARMKIGQTMTIGKKMMMQMRLTTRQKIQKFRTPNPSLTRKSSMASTQPMWMQSRS